MLPPRINRPGVIPTPPRRPPETPRFCQRCGALCNPLWLDCPQCAAQADAAHKPTPGAIESLAPSVGGPRGTLQNVVGPLALYFSLLAISALTIILGSFWHAGPELVLLATAAGTLLVLAWCATTWDSMRPTLRQPAPFYWFAAAAGLGLATFGVAQITLLLITTVFHVPQLAISASFLHRGYGWDVIIFAACVQPAIIEELAFRGVILGGLAKILNAREAVFVSAALFMILHLSPLSFPHLLTIGLVLGYLRMKTGSIYPGMVLHFVHNLLCLVWEKFA